MGKPKLTTEEAAERQRERCRKYWAEHREEIAVKRKIKREQAKAEKEAREKQYQEQAKAFMDDIKADEDIQNALRARCEGRSDRVRKAESRNGA